MCFQSEKDLLWDSIKADLEEKIHILEEDKNNVDSLWSGADGHGPFGGFSFGGGFGGKSSGKQRRKADSAGEFFCFWSFCFVFFCACKSSVFS